ncbi:MAG: dTDP-glucose 4,6-dehydratase [Gammaproteobacteria bacterium]|nr:dTDP-glucose 4,6-dehydratase [Gammaproteobacteria bacterium]
MPKTNRETLLVTGGAGFIGANFVLEYLALTENSRVINLDKLTYAGNLSSLAAYSSDPRHIFIKGDIADRALLASLLEEHRPSAVINFAAESHVDRSIHAPEAFVQTNVMGTFNLLESVRVYWQALGEAEAAEFRFLHVSTDEVYGSLTMDEPAFTERHPYAPNSPYSASKAASDHMVRAYHHTYGLPVLTTNCSNNYGPLQFPEKLIPLIIHNALAGKSIPLYGDGENIRDWLYVGDHCSAIRAVLDKGRLGEVYNIGGNYEKSNLDIVHTVCDILDELLPESSHRPHKSLIKFVSDRPGHDRRYAIDPTKIATEIQWQPKETFESGIRKTVTWYLENQSWVEQIVSGEYQNWLAENYGERG